MNTKRVENTRGPSYEEKGKKGGTLTLETEAIKRLMRSGGLGEELLPGIPNYISLHMVSPMLSWGDLAMLSTVSPGWQEAGESGLVYNERVRSHSTESLTVVTVRKEEDKFSFDDKTFLYSMKGESWYELSLPGEMLIVVKCVALHSKLYVIGPDILTKFAVYVLDLVGEKQWKQCASLKGFTLDLLATGMHGKIYVFSGYDDTAGVYDPKVDAWSNLHFGGKFMDTLHIVTLGDEIFLQRGDLQDAEVYHPDSGLWRVIKDFDENRPTGVPVLAQGKFFLLNSDGIFGLNIDEQSWTLLQSCSYPFPQRRLDYFIACLAVGHELVAVAAVYLNNPRTGRPKFQQNIFLQSCGFGQENKEVMWEAIAIPGHDRTNIMPVFYPKTLPYSPSIECSIQL